MRVGSGDVTHVFWAQGGYWPSYNIPYFPNIYEISGYPAMAQKSVQYSYTQCARAQIFARNHTEVVDDVSMRRLMQYNDFQHDPLVRVHDPQTDCLRRVCVCLSMGQSR